MSILNNSLLLGADAGGYQIERSLRFNTADSTRLDRTFGTATTQNTFTFAAWIKRAGLGTLQQIFGVSTNHSLGFTSGNALNLTFGGSSALTTTALFRDPSAWYHIVWTQSGSSHTLYVNNLNVGTATATSSVFNTAVAHQIGAANSSNYLGAYLTDVHFIDGQALTPSSFAETDATTGQWVPKAYTGTYGTNGFKLNFADNSNNTATTLGKDTSGNGNNWTPTNLSVTAGEGDDSLVDSPTNYGTDTGAGGEVRGNYATLNPISTVTTVALANGNLAYSSTTTGQNALATIGMSSGKWYWEVVTTAGTTDTRVGVYSTAASSLFSLAANSTVYGIRFNADTGALDRTSDGTNWTSIATGLTSGPYFPYFNNNGTTSKTVSTNFGQRSFAYTAPSGFKALCTQNLPVPTITKPSTVMDVITYTGTGASLTPTSSLDFSPDLVWIKSRSAATDHAMYDTVRGTTFDIASNLTTAETTQAQGVTAFNSNGFTVGTLAKLNTNAATYTAWLWDAGSSNASNTSGTINSTVRANTSAGFSIVTYTGNGTAGATIGHGLGVAPTWIMIKSLSAANAWQVYTTALDGSYDFFVLNSTAAKTDSTQSVPTSSVFSVASGGTVNGNGTTYVAYCWTPVAGLSTSFTWTGNGSADGRYIHLGFRPAFLLLKQATSASTTNWVLLDDRRLGYNVDNDPQYPNLAAVDGTTDLVDFTANGFKIRSTDGSINASSGTYVGYAWAEFPFQYARAR